MLFPNTNSCFTFYMTDRIKNLLKKKKKIRAFTETFNYLFHGFHSLCFFWCLVFFFLQFFLLFLFYYHSFLSQHTALVTTLPHIAGACLSPHHAYKLLNSESGNTQNWAITGEFQGGCLFMQILCFWHTCCRESTEFLSQANSKTENHRSSE